MGLDWATGHEDKKPDSVYAEFTDHFDRLKTEHCTGDGKRRRDYERARQILERTCECGNEKMTTPDGSLGDGCRQCHDIEE